MVATNEKIDSLKSEEPGTFSHVRDIRVDRQVDRLERTWADQPSQYATPTHFSTGAVLRLF